MEYARETAVSARVSLTGHIGNVDQLNSAAPRTGGAEGPQVLCYITNYVGLELTVRLLSVLVEPLILPAHYSARLTAANYLTPGFKNTRH